MGWLIGLFCGCGGAVAILFAASGLLQLAVSLTNRMVGPSRTKVEPKSSGGIAEWDWDDWDDEDTRGAEPVRPWRRPPVIPEPGTGKGAAIMLATALVFVVGFVATGIAAEEFVGLRMWREESKLLVSVLNLPVAALALTLLLIGMLPTTFWRAAMVVFVYGLIILAFVLCIGTIVVVLRVVVR